MAKKKCSFGKFLLVGIVAAAAAGIVAVWKASNPVEGSVLAQAGLLDPAKLPVVGAEAAEKVLNPSSHPSNQICEIWHL